MQETGIVRRIDELGRIVVPKEIRRTMRIKEGDPLEIYLDKDRLTLKKYSPINRIEAIAKSVAEGIESLTKKPCLITDCDKVIYSSKTRFFHAVGRSISGDIEKVLSNRKSVNLSRIEGEKTIALYDGEDFPYENQIIVPIISSGDCLGSVIIFDDDKFNKFNQEHLRLVELGSTFLSKQFD